jgi:hypothetical protein
MDEKRRGELEALVAAYRAGEGLVALAKQYHVDWHKVKAALVKAGVPLRDRGEGVRQARAHQWAPGEREAVVQAYQAGASLRQLAAAHRIGDRQLKQFLTQAGLTLRTLAEAARQRALSPECRDLASMSAARWRELYWGKEQPSVAALARRFGVSEEYLASLLDQHGFRRRTQAEQQRIEARTGRWQPGARAGLTPEVYAKHRAAYEAGHEKARRTRQTREARARYRAARQRFESRLCVWCGETVTRTPHLFVSPPERTYCTLTCSARHKWYRIHHPGAPRPLILERLRAALGKGPVTGERLDRIAPSVGAGEAEIVALMMEAR